MRRVTLFSAFIPRCLMAAAAPAAAHSGAAGPVQEHVSARGGRDLPTATPDPKASGAADLPDRPSEYGFN